MYFNSRVKAGQAAAAGSSVCVRDILLGHFAYSPQAWGFPPQSAVWAQQVQIELCRAVESDKTQMYPGVHTVYCVCVRVRGGC